MTQQKILESLLRTLRIVKSFYNNFEQVEKVVESMHRLHVEILDVKLVVQKCREKYRTLHVCNLV